MQVVHMKLKKEILRTTEGLLDEQIMKRTAEQIEDEIHQAKLAIDGLQKHIDDTHARIASLRKVLQRRLELGD
jgi:peptidoglycan hydrolase CwlO-like protein